MFSCKTTFRHSPLQVAVILTVSFHRVGHPSFCPRFPPCDDPCVGYALPSRQLHVNSNVEDSCCPRKSAQNVVGTFSAIRVSMWRTNASSTWGLTPCSTTGRSGTWPSKMPERRKLHLRLEISILDRHRSPCLPPLLAQLGPIR